MRTRTVDGGPAVRCGTSRLAAAALGAAALLGLVTAGLARDDDGSHTFFRDQIDRQAAPAAQRSPAYAPLTIRRETARRFSGGGGSPFERHAQARPLPFGHRVRTRGPLLVHLHGATDPASAAAGSPAGGPVSIFRDATLRAGDVVILKDGPRVFTGAQHMPYTPKDFVSYKDSRSVKKELRDNLTAIDKNPLQHL